MKFMIEIKLSVLCGLYLLIFGLILFLLTTCGLNIRITFDLLNFLSCGFDPFKSYPCPFILCFCNFFIRKMKHFLLNFNSDSGGLEGR